MPGVAFPAGLSHDRYLIYEMMGQQVSFTVHNRKENKKVVGVTEQVCRDIFEGHVELTVNGQLFRFKEPAVMILDSDRSIIFVYGSKDDNMDEGDDALFGVLRGSMETIDDVIARSAPSRTHVQRFVLGPREEMTKTA